MLPEEAARRARAARPRRASCSSGAGYGRIETPTFEATELFARGVGESTDIVQKEMYTFEDGGGRSLTLRPEGTAPVCRAYVEHGMHKLAAAGEALVPGAVLPRRARRRPAATASSGSSAPRRSAPTTRRSTPSDRAAGRRSSSAPGVRGLRLRLSSLGTPETRARVPRGAARLPARPRGRALRRTSASGIDAQPAARLRLRPPGHAGGDGRAPRCCSTASTPRTPSTSPTVRALLDARASPYEIDPTLVRGLDYYTRTVFEFTSRRARRPERRRRRRALRRAGRAARRAADARRGLGRRDRADPAGRRREPPGADARSCLRRRWPSPSARARAFALVARRCARAGLRAQIELAGRSLKGQLKQADRLGARYVVIVGRRRLRADGHGERRAARRRADERAVRDVRERGDDEAPRAPTATATRWCGDAARRATSATSIRVAGWVHRRRDHGGLIFIDLRDRSGLAAARLPPRDGAEAYAAAERLRSEHVISRRAATLVRARGGQRQPEPAHRRDRAAA